MTLVGDIKEYTRFLMTTRLTLDELNTIIRECEHGMKDYDVGTVTIQLNKKGIQSIIMNGKMYSKNGNGGNGNGHV